MDEDRRAALVAGYLEGTLGAAEARELAAEVGASAEAAAAVARQIALHRALVQVGRPALDVDELMHALPARERSSVDEVMRSIAAGKMLPPPGAPRPRRAARPAALFGAAGAGLAAAAAVVLVLALRGRDRVETRADPGGEAPAETASAPARPPPGQRPAAARLERVSGRVYVVARARSDAALAGRPLADGEGLVTVGAGSSASVAYADGTRLELGGDAVVAQLTAAAAAAGPAPPALAGDPAAGKAVFVARGTVLGHVARQPEGAPLTFATPHAEATVLGARLQIVVAGDSTRVSVHEGRVHVRPARGAGAAEVTAGRYALVREGAPPALADQPRGGLALLVTGGSAPHVNPSDKAVRQRLEKLGFEARLASVGLPTFIGDAQGAALVVVSSTVSSADVDDRLRHVPVPILTWEAQLFGALGMTAPCADGDCGEVEGRHGILIKDVAHPLAAGLTGVVEASRTGGRTSWGTPGVHAHWIATLPGNPTKATVFAYERGAAMPGGLAAPARRLGLFMTDDTAEGLTDAGWSLFDAAVAWCTERATVP